MVIESINNSKKKEILKFLRNNREKWFTLNQVKDIVKIHIYKAELLMYQLLAENEVELDERGKFKFWSIKDD